MPGFGMTRGQFFCDAKAFKDHASFGHTDSRHGLCGGVAFQQFWQFVRVKSGGLGLDRDAEGIKQQPAAQGPTGIRAVADRKVIGHVALRFSGRLGEGRRAEK